MKSLFIVLIVIILSSSVIGLSQDTAQVSLTVINRNPEITELKLTPETLYSDSTVKCIGIIDDEQPETTTLDVAWYINGEFVKRGETLEGFNENDRVTCSAIAKDSAKQLSIEEKQIITIQKQPKSAKQTMFFSNLLGTSINTEKALELEREGLSSITGYAVKNSRYTGQTSGLLIIIVVLGMLTLLNIRKSMKKRIKSYT